MEEPVTKLPQRPFGRTGKSVGVLGLGTVKFGRNRSVKYPSGEGFALPTDAEIAAILDLAIDHGITLLDTAPAYGVAEERLGGLLGARRQKFFLSTKAGEEFDGEKSEYIFTAAHIRMSVERSLRRLSTDYLDCVLVHSNRDDMKVLRETDALPALMRLKEEGKVGAVGMSTYSVQAGVLAAETCDAVMVAYHEGYADEAAVIARAAGTGAAVLVKKPLGSGHVADAAAALRFAAAPAGVTCVVAGSVSRANILSNIKALLNA